MGNDASPRHAAGSRGKARTRLGGVALALLLAAACASPPPGTARPREDRVSIAFAPGSRRATDEGVRRWVLASVAQVASIYGDFPFVPIEVRVEPVSGGGGDPVVFGQATGIGGNPVVRLLLREDADDASLRRDWVAVHELLHLAMPSIRREDAWLSEGFATWATEFLRARDGLQTEEEAWTEVLLGFQRGRRPTGRTLAEDSRLLHRTHAYMRVYWGGAAIALLLDADLRRGPEGKTLEDALRAMREMELADAEEVSAEEWMERLDGWLGRPLFSRTAGACLASEEFPPVEAVLADLGVSLRGARAALDDAAPCAEARRAMTAPIRRP